MQVEQLQGWCPIRVNWQATPSAQGVSSELQPWADWCYLGETRFTEPFFSDTINACLRHPFQLLFRHQTPLSKLEELHTTQPGLRPTGFIFHMSRCGSTLISQMLASLPCNIVLSEVPPLDSVLRAPLEHTEVTEEQQILWLQWLVSALGRPRHSTEQHLFIKFDCWHPRYLPLITRAFPGVPWIFVYRDPVEVMASHLKQKGVQMLPGVLEPELFELDSVGVQQLSFEEYGARVLASICRAAVQYAHCGQGRFVHYPQLPEAVWTWLPAVFGVDYSAADLARMRRVAEFNAKHPTLYFEDDTAHKRQAATASLHQVVDHWVRPVYEELKALHQVPLAVSI